MQFAAMASGKQHQWRSFRKLQTRCCCLPSSQVLLAGLLLNVAGGTAKGVVKLAWPIHISKSPMSSSEAASLESPAFGKELAELGLKGFEEYQKQVLPRELELDAPFAEEFRTSDHSRVNLAFLRWQKRVYGEQQKETWNGGPVDHLAGRIELSPRLEEINYTWPELYKNATFRRLRSRINELAKMYLTRSGAEPDVLPKRFKIFAWVEIFKKGDSLRPWARTDGGFLMGRYWPQKKKNAMKFNFEDPRGINPPFGKTHHHEADEGYVSMFPTWASHFITPNLFKKPVVCFAFIVYPDDGNTMDFEDDVTASMVKTEPLQLQNTGQNHRK